MELIHPSQLKLTGEFDERIKRAMQFLVRLNNEEMRRELAHPDSNWHWGADYMGRWIAATGLTSQYTGEDYGSDKVTAELIAYQESDGSFGPYAKPHDFQEWFGMGRGLIGLVEYYSVNQDPAVLQSAIRLGDYITANYPEEIETFLECYTSGLEGMVQLYSITRNSRYLDSARRIAEASSLYKEIWSDVALDDVYFFRKPTAGQTHSQLLTARGLLDLYETTGEDRYLKPVLAFANFVRRQLMWISGGIPEFVSTLDANETCSDADWLRLNLQLWRITGKHEYMEIAENTLFNQLFFDQNDEGGFCVWRNLNGLMGATMDMCCAMHGPRAFWEAMRYVYTFEPDLIQVNLYLDGSLQFPFRLSKELAPLCLHCKLTYTSDQLIATYQIETPPSKELTFRARVPQWAGSCKISVNERIAASQDVHGYAEIKRIWSDGDRLEIRLPFKVRVLKGNRIGEHIYDPGAISVFLGPRLLCFTELQNLDVLPPFVTIQLSQGFKVLGPDRVEATGCDAFGKNIPLFLSPLANIGGSINSQGRTHPVRTQYYKVWIPTSVKI